MRTAKLLASVSALIALGCTKATPGFDTLDSSSIPQPLFSGATSETVSTTSNSTTFSISGTCDFKINSIVAQAVGAGSQGALSAVSVGTPTVDCQSSGKFSFTLKSLTDLGFSASENQTFVVNLYGMTTSGLSRASSINISFASPNSNGPKRMILTSGGTESSSSGPRLATSTDFKAEIRVDHRMLNYANPSVTDAMTVQTSSGGNFKAKIGAAASAN
jgi:hypothetical protein